MPAAKITNERVKVLAARLCVLLFGLIAYGLALSDTGIYDLVEQASALGSSGTLVVISFALFSNFGGSRAALATLMIGTGSYVVLSLAGWMAPFLASVALSLTTYVCAGVLERRLFHNFHRSQI